MSQKPEQAAALVRRETSKVVKLAGDLVITTPDQLAGSTTLLSQIKAAQKLRQESYDRVAQPLKHALDELKALFEPMKVALDHAEETIKTKMLVYRATVREAAERKEAQIQKRLKAGTLKPETAKAQLDAVDQTLDKTAKGVAGGQIQFRTVIDVIIMEPDLVPDAYWVIDEPALRKAVLGGTLVPGVEKRTREVVAAT